MNGYPSYEPEESINEQPNVNNIKHGEDDAFEVNVEVDGKPLTLIVDTGADVNVLSFDIAKHLGLKIMKLKEVFKFSTVGSQRIAKLVVEPTMKLGKTSKKTLFYLVEEENQRILARDNIKALGIQIDPQGITLLPEDSTKMGTTSGEIDKHDTLAKQLKAPSGPEITSKRSESESTPTEGSAQGRRGVREGGKTYG
ncbi:hypothetical protein QR98_0014140 [Sarcoptes scabiei]|uniref:Peptidase A2 domain-containing protein n=1 Tax=Sarcoptes scabiei TaxID=52283 RepID=A0A131ZWF6_SARSC|nr:hypothetical protein QR98_0014140 [Sarcoptes scabiei]